MNNSSRKAGRVWERGRLALIPAGGTNRAHNLVEGGRVQGETKGRKGIKGRRAVGNIDSCR